MGDSSEVVMFPISSCEPWKWEWLWSSGPYAALSTPFTLLWTVCLWRAQEGRDGNTLVAARRMCESLSLSLPVSLSVSLLCVHVCVCVFMRVCVWGIMADQTWLCGRCKFNHIFFSLPAAHFWIWFSPSSKANQIDTYWKRRFVHDWIFTWAALTGMAVNL